MGVGVSHDNMLKALFFSSPGRGSLKRGLKDNSANRCLKVCTSSY